MKSKLVEAIAWLSLAVTLLGVPWVLWDWRDANLAAKYPEGTKVFTLTAIAKDGIWTLEDVNAQNYWRKDFERVPEIALQKGDHVVVRLKSVDVLHSFAIPLLRIGPIDVPAGHVKEIEFDADRSGNLAFLCWQVCSSDHEKLKGRFVVEGDEDEESAEGEEGDESPW